jgi:transposase InsO family protein
VNGGSTIEEYDTQRGYPIRNRSHYTTDQGSSFMSHQFKEFAASLKIKLLNSSPYYAQANSQAESSNKILIRLIKKKIEESLRRWHKVLSEALWAR